jgi:hypothetical protein
MMQYKTQREGMPRVYDHLDRRRDQIAIDASHRAPGLRTKLKEENNETGKSK